MRISIIGKVLKFLIFVVIVSLLLYLGKDKWAAFWYESSLPRLPAAINTEKGDIVVGKANQETTTDDKNLLAQPNASAPSAPVDTDISASSFGQMTAIIPTEYNLAVPFAPQAPQGNWDLPYQEACEEASLIMADRFLKGRGLTAQEMDIAIKNLVDWQLKRFGYYEDTTAAEVAVIAQEYFKLNAKLDFDISPESIKRYIAAGNLVLIPAAGRILPNPYFSGEGPLYHMLVIRGYTDKYFITNDPGTRRGQEFVYKYDDLINAIHDWPRPNGGSKGDVSEAEMLKGQKVMIVVSLPR